MKTGYFITFEGGEGSGKSTQIRLAASYFRRKGKKVVVLREPGSTEVGEKIRGILLNPETANVRPETELLLYLAARAQLVQDKILPALAQNKIVVCDRFEDSTVAYQAFGRGISRDLIERLGKFVRQSLKPDLTFLLSIDPGMGMKRTFLRANARRRKSRPDRMEMQSVGFHRKVSEGFRSISREEKKRFVVIRGDLTKQEVQAVIREKLDSVFK